MNRRARQEPEQERQRVNGPDPSYVCQRCGERCVCTGDFPFCSYACHYYSDAELAVSSPQAEGESRS